MNYQLSVSPIMNPKIIYEIKKILQVYSFKINNTIIDRYENSIVIHCEKPDPRDEEE